MSDDQISPEALARKKRFLEAKEAAGGTAGDLIQQQQKKNYTLYFDEAGEIVCFTKEDVVVNPEWLTHDFTQDQLKILIGKEKEFQKYRVKIDSKVDNLYSIELKPIENANIVDANKDFLYNIEPSESKIWDIKIKVTETHLQIFMHDKIKEEYKDVYPISATRNGARLCKFYITAKDDPHTLFYYSTISLAELLSDDFAQRKLPSDLRNCSVFTIKLFDTYVRNDKD